MNKKGISPLIGTVLLVAIVIAMVLLIMPWVTNMIEKQKQRTTEASRQFDCITELNFDIIDSDGLKIDNKGDVAIQEVRLRIYKVGGSITPVAEPYTTPIPSYSLSGDLGVACADDTDRIEAIATIRSEGKDIVCSDAPKDYYC